MNIWTGKLLHEVKFGHVIIIGGIVKPNPIKISIDFSQNEVINYKSSDNIILHLSVRFMEKQIIRSSHFPNVGWSNDQISDNLIGKLLKNPLKAGQQFTIRLTILQAIYQVHINEELYCTYDQNGPVNDINYVQVKHDYALINHFHHRTLFPNVFPPYPLSLDVQQNRQEQNHQELTADNQQDEQLQYIMNSDSPMPLKLDNLININGYISGLKSGEFGIDLFNNNTNVGVSPKIAMRFNPNYNLKQILLNAQRQDDLRFDSADEEICNSFPFKRGKSFSIGLSLQRNAFHIYVNGEFLTYFNLNYDEPCDLGMFKCWTKNGMHLTITSIEYYKSTSQEVLFKNEKD